MANLVVLECHLWLNSKEIKDTKKAGYLNSQAHHIGLFGSAVVHGYDPFPPWEWRECAYWDILTNGLFWPSQSTSFVQQIPAPQSIGMPGAQDQHDQKIIVSQPVNIFTRHSSRFISENSAAYCAIQCQDLTPTHRLQGPMAAPPSAELLGLLHMRPLQYWLKAYSPCLPSEMPQSQGDPCLRQSPGPLESSPSVPDWDRSGAGDQEESNWHIMAVFLALKALLLVLRGLHILVCLDNMMVVAHINHQKGKWKKVTPLLQAG